MKKGTSRYLAGQIDEGGQLASVWKMGLFTSFTFCIHFILWCGCLAQRKREKWHAWAKFCLSLLYCLVLFNKTSPEPGQSVTEYLKEGRQFSIFSLVMTHALHYRSDHSQEQVVMHYNITCTCYDVTHRLLVLLLQQREQVPCSVCLPLRDSPPTVIFLVIVHPGWAASVSLSRRPKLCPEL